MPASLERNQGALIAKNQLLLFLDADVDLDSESFEKADHEQEKSGLEVAGVYMNGKGLSPLHRAGYDLFNAGFFVTQFIFPTVVGACIFSFKRAMDEYNWLCSCRWFDGLN